MEPRHRFKFWSPKPAGLIDKLSRPIRSFADSTGVLLRKTPIGGVTETLTKHTAAPLTIRTGHRSICGCVRKRNEDYCYASSSGQVLVVADGMGGYTGGANASRIATRTFAHDLAWLSGERKVDKCVLKAKIHRCVKHARHEMIEWVETHPRDNRMGTTIAVAMVVGQRLYVASVGDSRIYLYRNGRIRQLTVDETLAQALVEAGAMTPENAAHSRYRHLLTNSVSVKELKHLPDVTSYAIQPGDRLLLATDGFSDFVSEEDIDEVLATIECPQVACDLLVSKAVQNDSTDNITVVIADVIIDSNLDALPVEEASLRLPWQLLPSESLATVACASPNHIAECI